MKKLLRNLSQTGIEIYLSPDKKLKYRSRQPPDGKAAFLLEEVKAHKQEIIEYLQSAEYAIRQAWAGKLKSACLIAPRQEYTALWGGNVWLCPTDADKKHIRQKYPGDFPLSAKEFFDICQGIADGGRDMEPVIRALQTFGGSLEVSA
ncbi:MAG: hypothetical protein ABFD50_05185 [Smithella sp.]